MQAAPPPEVVSARELRIVDDRGQTRILLSAKSGAPTILLLGADGKATLTAQTDAAGRPAVTLANPLATGPTAVIEIDAKGAHVKFDRPGGASAYLFLNNQGMSGTVLIDAAGRRRFQATVAADGTSRIERLDESGKPLP
jgi:hypothetical protein